MVAGRLKDKFGKPVCIISTENGEGKGSGRSVPGIHIAQAFIDARHAGLLIKGGGHAMAAGLSMDPTRLDELLAYLEERTKGATFELAEARVLEIDGALAPGAADGALLEMIERIGPFGSNAPEPLFAVPNVRAAGARRVGENHMAFDMIGEDGSRVRAIAFRVADGPEGQAIARGDAIHVAGRLRPDTWRGPGKVQIEVADISLA